MFHLNIWPWWKEFQAREAVISVSKTEKMGNFETVSFLLLLVHFNLISVTEEETINLLHTLTELHNSPVRFSTDITAWIKHIHTAASPELSSINKILN